MNFVKTEGDLDISPAIYNMELGFFRRETNNRESLVQVADFSVNNVTELSIDRQNAEDFSNQIGFTHE